MLLSLIAARSAAVPPADTTTSFITQLLPLVLIFAVFYFLLIRPQQRRLKAHNAKVGAVSRNDTVVTGGGIVGKVVKVEDDFVHIEIAKGLTVKVVKSTLSDVTTTLAKPAND